MDKKYDFTDETNAEGLHRIAAVRDLMYVPSGTLGGMIESGDNLSHQGNCWVGYGCSASGNARVTGDARVSDFAKVSGRARVGGNCFVSEHAKISGDASVEDYAYLGGHAVIKGFATVGNRSCIYGDSVLTSSDDLAFLAFRPYNVTMTPRGIVIGCHRKTYAEWVELPRKHFDHEITEADYKSLRLVIMTMWRAWFKDRVAT